METKACSKCSVVKPLTDFYKNAKSAGGFKARCKACDAAAVARKPKIGRRLDAESEKMANAHALHRLVKQHPSEFFSLLAEERAKVAGRR